MRKPLVCSLPCASAGLFVLTVCMQRRLVTGPVDINERRRRELYRGVWACLPKNFWKFESLKWPFPAFWDKFRTRLISVNFAFVKKKISKKRGGGGGTGPLPPLDPPLSAAFVKGRHSANPFTGNWDWTLQISRVLIIFCSSFNCNQGK